MIGYGLLNSKIQEFCLGGIINSFLNRSVIYLYPYYLYYDSKDEEGKKTIIKNLYDIFIQEELKLSSRLFKNFDTFKKEWEEKLDPKAFSESDLIYAYYINQDTKKVVENIYDTKGFNTSLELSDEDFERYPDLIIKYILSANIAQDKDYNFASKTIEQVKSEGKENLKNLFRKVFEEFYYGDYFGGTKQKINPIQDWPKYYESIKLLVYDFFIDIYNNVIDTNDLAGYFQNWWDPTGNDFINSLSTFISSIDVNNINKTDDIQKLKLFNDAIEKFKKARQNVPNFIDELDDAPIIAPFETNQNIILPLDVNGKQIDLKKTWTEFDSDGEIAFKVFLDYLFSILNFYYNQLIKTAGSEFVLNTIFDKVNDYIKFVINNNSNSDSLDTTLNNLSIYFVEQKGYLKNINKIITFYKEKNILKERSYYLRLLTEQINSLQETKVDEYEKYIGT
jgi:hypothetical protein